MKKFLWGIGIGVLLVIMAIAIGIGLYIGPIVKIALEELGPKVIRVPIKVDAVNLSLLTGSAKVKGLFVGNPDGYKLPQAIHVGTIAVGVDSFSVLSNKIMVRTVHIESPEITLEGGLTRNNLTKIMDNVNALAPKSGSESSHDSNAGNKPAPKIEVDDLLITGAKVHVSLTGLFGKTMSLPLPEIHLTDLGKNSNGITMAELIRVILKAVIKDTVKAVTGSVTDLGHGVLSIGKGTGQTVDEGVNKIVHSLGGLFGK